jgi:very-short-patch-repair endonuclease
MNKKYNWEEIQKLYDEGNSTRDLHKSIGINLCSIHKAIKRGDLKTRTLSEAMILDNKKHPRSIPENVRKKISDKIKKYYKDNPECHPNRRLANNRNKWTYPERMVAEFLEELNIPFDYNKKILKYYPDFLVKNNIIIEVDGDRWHSSKEAKEKDSIRDKDLSDNGYIIYRLSFKGNVKLLKESLNSIFKNLGAWVNG